MTKFHYNPISLTKTTRKLFDHLKTLYIYSTQDYQFKNDFKIIGKVDAYINTLLSQKEQKQLEEWTGLQCSEVLFDSDYDNWSEGTSVFDDKLFKKEHLIFLIEDEDGEKFGYYSNTEVIKEYYKPTDTRSKVFHFNLQSKNERLQQPMKFPIQYRYLTGWYLAKKSDMILFGLGEIVLYKENRKNRSYCYQHNDVFNYHGIENALCGKERKEYGKMYFNPKRILVIQMK